MAQVFGGELQWRSDVFMIRNGIGFVCFGWETKGETDIDSL